MIKKLILTLAITISSSVFALGYDILPSAKPITPQITPIDFSSKITSQTADEYLPLFTQTCDNISYTGAIEQQAINILEDVKMFVKKITDPIVSVSKFDAGIFFYAFGKCMSETTKEEFDPTCGDKKTGQGCLVDRFYESIHTQNKVLSIEAGLEAGDASAGVDVKKEINIDKVKNSPSQMIELMVGEGWFERLFECTQEERSKVLRFLDNIFKKNFKIKTSIITSINKKCSVSLRESGDPKSWSEIYELNKSMIGGNQSKTSQNIENFFKKNIKEVTRDEAEEFSKWAGESGGCINGVGNNCISAANKKTLDRISKLAITELDRKEYNPENAYKITRDLFVVDILSSEYTNTVGSTINPIKKVLADLIPLSDNQDMPYPKALNEVQTEQFIVDFQNQKDSFFIQPNTLLSNNIESIFYQVTAPRFILTLENKDTGKLYSLPDKLVYPKVNPFYDGVISYNNKFVDDSLLIARTYSGKTISLNSIPSSINTKSLIGFYRSMVTAMIFANNESEEDYLPKIAIFKKNQLIDDDAYELIKVSLAGAIETHSKFNYSHILNSDSILAKRAGEYRSSIEYFIIKSLLTKRIVEMLFTTPTLAVSKVKLHYEVPTDIFYGFMTGERDFMLPRLYDDAKVSKMTHRFYQSLSSKYIEYSIIDKIEIATLQAEQYDDMNNMEVKINTLIEQISVSNETQSINNIDLINSLK